MKKIIFLGIFFCLITATVEAKIGLKEKESFKAGFYLSEMENYAYDKEYMETCKKNLLHFAKISKDKELFKLIQDIQWKEPSKYLEFSKSVQVKSQKYYNLKSDQEKIHFIYGAQLSNVGLGIVSETDIDKYSPGFTKLYSYLKLANNESAGHLATFIDELNSSKRNSETMKKSLYSIFEVYSIDSGTSLSSLDSFH